MKLKPGVQIVAAHPAILHAIDVADWYWRLHFDRHVVVTSIQDGRHSDGSFHYGTVGDVRARAVDLRTRDLTADEKVEAEMDLRRLLGESFDVVLESTHLHVELDLTPD